jgi:copper chaperone
MRRKKVFSGLLKSCIMDLEFYRHEGGELIMTKATLKIQGMTCNHCVMRVAKALKAVPGVQDAQVDMQKAEAIVTYDEGKVAQDKLSFAVVEAGYKVV